MKIADKTVLVTEAVSAKTAGLTMTLGLAAACWVVVVRQMKGMDMGVATELGSFGSFIPLWATMMAAMMLPGAVPAVMRYARANAHGGGVSLFTVSYLAVWTLVGIAVYAFYQPHETLAAGAVVIAAGIYELTPLKRYFRLCCREDVSTGLRFGLNCIGSSMGLMLMLVALGVMSLTWMSVIAVLIVTQKLLPPRDVIDVLVGLGIIGFGILIVLAPWSVPGLTPPM